MLVVLDRSIVNPQQVVLPTSVEMEVVQVSERNNIVKVHDDIETSDNGGNAKTLFINVPGQ